MALQLTQIAEQYNIQVDQLYIDRFWSSLYSDKWIYIDSEIVQWIGYSEAKVKEGKRYVLGKLREQFVEGTDFKLVRIEDIEQYDVISHIDTDMIRTNSVLIVDPDVFKELLLTMSTTKARQVQKYFLAVERLCRKFMQAQLSDTVPTIKRMPLEANEVVYIISNARHAKADLYKIGRTKNLKARLSCLNTSNPDRANDRLQALMIIHTYDSKSMEEMIHAHLDAYRHSGSKEWFQIEFDKLRIVVEYFQKVARKSIDIVNNLSESTTQLALEPPPAEPSQPAEPSSIKQKNKYACPNCTKIYRNDNQFYRGHLKFCKPTK